LATEVRLARSGATAEITIDHPPVNALHPHVSDAIDEHLFTIAADTSVRCVILTGSGSHFVAGADLQYVQGLDRDAAERYVLRVQAMQDHLQLLPQPVIAAVNGTALGGGCELAMACDIRIAEERARFGQPEVSLGLIPGAGGTQNLPRLVPMGRAKRMLFTGERITARVALEIGLVDEVVADGTSMDAARSLADRIGHSAPLAVTAAKRAVNLGLQTGVVEGYRLEAALFAPLVETRDFAEGTAAFFEKRDPNFERR
jgi:enoyl-CoA hydratase